MSTDSIRWPQTETAAHPLVDKLHEWVTTVDHKRLGILYIIYALVFLLIGGIEATVIRIQLIRPHNDFVSPQVFNRMFTMHGTTMILDRKSTRLNSSHDQISYAVFCLKKKKRKTII